MDIEVKNVVIPILRGERGERGEQGIPGIQRSSRYSRNSGRTRYSGDSR